MNIPLDAAPKSAIKQQDRKALACLTVSNCNPWIEQEEQPLNLHMLRGQSAQVVGA